MTVESTPGDDRDAGFESVILAYLEAADAGRAPRPDELRV